MSTTLYRKYRPQLFSEVVGQKHIITTLENALTLGRVGQAYLLTGPHGTGKTTIARLFAKAINCSERKKNSPEPCNKCQHCLLMAEGRSLDIIEIDAASHTGVDNIRELRETVNLPPTLGSHKIYIIDEVHMLSIGAWNALLKTLEEPPAHVIFIFATTALHKVPDTIISRCQRFDLARFPVTLIVHKLTKIAKQEKLKIDAGALEMIALTAEGGMRDAESLLTQIASLEVSPITEDVIIEILGTTKKENVVSLLRLIANSDLYPSLAFVRTLAQDGVDLAIFCGIFLHYLRDLLLVSADPKNGPNVLENLTDEQKSVLLELATQFTPDAVVRMLEYIQVAQVESKTAVIPELPLEIAIVKILSQKNTEDSHTSLPMKPTTSKPSQTFITSLASDGDEQKKVQPKTPIKTEPETSTISTPDITHHSSIINHQSPNIDLDTVKKHWQAILNTAKKLNASLTLALSTARPVETTGTTVTIAVKYPFHKERLDAPANQLTLANAFDTILQSKTRIRIVVEDALAESTPETKSSAPKTINPLVSQAIDILGGTLVQEN